MRGLADGSTRGPTTDSNNGTEHERTSIQDLPRHGGPTFSNLLLYKTYIVTMLCDAPRSSWSDVVGATRYEVDRCGGEQN